MALIQPSCTNLKNYDARSLSPELLAVKLSSSASTPTNEKDSTKIPRLLIAPPLERKRQSLTFETSSDLIVPESSYFWNTSRSQVWDASMSPGFTCSLAF